jgi:rhomboid protease GluP
VSVLDEVVVAVTADGREVDEWALVLASAGVPYRLEQAPASWRLLVAADDVGRATAALDAYGHEQARRRPPAEPASEYGPTPFGAVAALVLAGFYLVTGPRNPASPWYAAGSGDATSVRAGELWRTVTALTLHANAPHLLGNMAGMVVFASGVARALGPGVAAILVVLAGAGGNLANAYLHRDEHVSVGASTAVFGAIGILGGLAAIRRRPARPAWIPIAGSLALLAMLGTDLRADLGAHAFGLVCGVGLGLAAAAVLPRPPGTATQWTLAVAAAAMVAGSWMLALG